MVVRCITNFYYFTGDPGNPSDRSPLGYSHSLSTPHCTIFRVLLTSQGFIDNTFCSFIYLSCFCLSVSYLTLLNWERQDPTVSHYLDLLF